VVLHVLLLFLFTYVCLISYYLILSFVDRIFFVFFFNDTPTTEIYTLSLHDALPIFISFTKGLATELARHNILVNCVAPGWVATDMSNPVLETKAGQKMAGTVIPLRRAGTPEEIAGPILFVASDLANFMTGEVVNVNGGAVLCG